MISDSLLASLLVGAAVDKAVPLVEKEFYRHKLYLYHKMYDDVLIALEEKEKEKEEVCASLRGEIREMNDACVWYNAAMTALHARLGKQKEELNRLQKELMERANRLEMIEDITKEKDRQIAQLLKEKKERDEALIYFQKLHWGKKGKKGKGGGASASGTSGGPSGTAGGASPSVDEDDLLRHGRGRSPGPGTKGKGI